MTEEKKQSIGKLTKSFLIEVAKIAVVFISGVAGVLLGTNI